MKYIQMYTYFHIQQACDALRITWDTHKIKQPLSLVKHCKFIVTVIYFVRNFIGDSSELKTHGIDAIKYPEVTEEKNAGTYLGARFISQSAVLGPVRSAHSARPGSSARPY